MINLTKHQEQILKDKISMLIIINGIITATLLMVLVPLLVTFALQERGYFAIGGEYIAMAFLIIALPLALWNIEKKWL
jgi:drug/metabolite transporter superfamily protein YnfA